ncbi:Surface antigen [Marinobacterium sp. xm-d-579]|uniref:BamA/TamA family outer membrane protein n=1 Tax=unclassified Marinobacterium TaxID=2644139 RepID=UPI001569698A|nr:MULTISPECIES: BamA/TamA family outer membrane protein [unclassified Marinobacterium]NRP10605.1 Surface antigen [Marinobacterium sp. xm-g-48]NRP35967.1 Surface antigen [Marinobacterium sp. xm-d-579]NRP83128.1 Surface antigen [Marinobacterium sp. xm-d-509]NRP94392.1 Surface antigen [Marinobacterium sp. xm-g-59]
MKRLSARLNLLLALLFSAVPSAVWALEQGFAVEANSEVRLSVNGETLSVEQLSDMFSIERVGDFDKYLALEGAFNGSEVLELQAFAVDAAGNRSAEPSRLELASLDTTAPEAPEIAQIANNFSERYTNGFELPAGSVPILSVNGLLVEQQHHSDWFEITQGAEVEQYVARPGLFDGTEVVEVAAYQVDTMGNESPVSETLTLLPIDTLSPGAPRILTLDQLLAESAPAFESEPLEIVVSADLPVQKPVVSAQSVIAESVTEDAVDLAPQLKSEKQSVIAKMPQPEADTAEDLQVVESAPAGAPTKQLDELEDIDALVARILDEAPKVQSEAAPAEPIELNTQVHKAQLTVTAVSAVKQAVDLPVEAFQAQEGRGESASENLELIDASTTILPEARLAAPAETQNELSITTHTPPSGISLIQSEVPGEMLAATNGIDPFEVLNVPYTPPEVDLKPKLPPLKPAPITRVFDLRTADDTQRLIDWMRLESDEISCPILETADGGTLDEILSCLDRLGYPQAQTVELPDGIRIDTGQKMRIESVGIHQVLDAEIALSPDFLADLNGKPLSKAEHVKAIDRLDYLGFVRDGSFDYYARIPGVYDAEVVGEAGESDLSVGASLTTGGKLFGALDGRHFFDYQGLRYLDYRVGSNIDGQYEIDLAVPVYYNLNNQLDLEFSTRPQEFRFFDSRATELSSRWRDFSGGDGLHLTEIKVSGEVHQTEVKSQAASAGQSVADQMLLSAKAVFEARPGWTEGDGLTLSIGLAQNLDRGSGYGRTDIDYDTGSIPLADTGLALNARVGASAISGDMASVPLSQRLYLGGADSVRGVTASYLGGETNLASSGGSTRVVSQVELSKPVTLFDQQVDLGVHLDAGSVSGGNLSRDRSAISAGLFGRVNISEDTSVYAHLSRANVDQNERSAFGLAIVKKF